MKRRKAIGTLLLAGGAVAAGFAGYVWFTLTKTPDREYLLSRSPLLIDLAEAILPATDTPGAREAGAVNYMMRLLNDCTDTPTLNRFIEGLRDLETYTLYHFHHPFSECLETEKQSVLAHFEQQAHRDHPVLEKVEKKIIGKPFFTTLKSYSVQGYCISEKGASLGMRYLAVPGQYLSCIPLEPNQKAWATK